MSGCAYHDECNSSFFKSELANDTIMSSIIKTDFCKYGSPSCARFCLYRELGTNKVPNHFYPYQSDDADKIIRNERLSDVSRSLYSKSAV
ncbi:MAG: hypothetical protein A2Y33_03125 [Spirochaetes bacterium GWF1_51_8]|nr:MAG: hypothetical protein A2Y33_03125 [Spirochaetes bacterium GWF1_51_8]